MRVRLEFTNTFSGSDLLRGGARAGTRRSGSQDNVLVTRWPGREGRACVPLLVTLSAAPGKTDTWRANNETKPCPPARGGRRAERATVRSGLPVGAGGGVGVGVSAAAPPLRLGRSQFALYKTGREMPLLLRRPFRTPVR